LERLAIRESDEETFARMQAEPDQKQLLRMYDHNLIPLAMAREVDPRRLRDIWNHGWWTAMKVLKRVYTYGTSPWRRNQDRLNKEQLTEVAEQKFAEAHDIMRLLEARFPADPGMTYVMASGKLAQLPIPEQEVLHEH
jgi:hypothetical protein